jgi:hypothetical protein
MVIEGIDDGFAFGHIDDTGEEVYEIDVNDILKKY